MVKRPKISLKSHLEELLARDSDWRKQFALAEQMDLNYRCELKHEKERAFIELYFGKSGHIRIRDVDVTDDQAEIKERLLQAAHLVHQESGRIFYPGSATELFYGYYQKGEREEQRFGLLIL